jgi:hypothetical protein
MEMHKRLALCALALASVLSACGGGGGPGDDSGPVPAAPRFEGILGGTVTRAGVAYAATAVISDGRLMAYDAGGRFYDTRYTTASGAITENGVSIYAINPAYGDSFDHVGFFVETVALALSAADETGVHGTIAESGGTTTFDLLYDRAADAQDSALSLVQGTWAFANASYSMSLGIAADGTTATSSTFGGAPYNCASSGETHIIDPAYGIYGWETTASGTACVTSAYTGLGFLTGAAAANDTLTVLLNDGAQFLALVFARQ